MSITAPTIDLHRLSSTQFKAFLAFPLDCSAEIYVKSFDTFSQQYIYRGSLQQPGEITISECQPFSYQQVFAISRKAADQISLPSFSSIDLNYPDSILSAVKSKWYSTPSLSAKFPGGMFANEVPESLNNKKLVMPYVIVRDTDRSFNFTTESTYFEGTNLEFVIFAPGAALIDECVEVVRENFDWKPLPFQKETNKTVSMQPVEQNVRSENFRYKDGNLIFRGSVLYDIIITRVL